MESLWAYIEGMVGLSLPVHSNNSFDLAAQAGLGAPTPSEVSSLLLNVLVLPNSSMHVATLYLGPMRSLWAYIEGMDGLHIRFMVANSSDLAAWARFGTLDLFDGRLLLQNSWMRMNFLQHVCTC